MSYSNHTSISSLKSYVATLEAESNAKQKELQLVVGSKYHDFIQSGHHIETMHECSKKIEDITNKFQKFNSDVVDKAFQISSLSTNKLLSLKFNFNQG